MADTKGFKGTPYGTPGTERLIIEWEPTPEQEPEPEPEPKPERSILINFVLDASGSMNAIRDATISGFNEFKNDQAREAGSALMTLTLFDTGFETVTVAVPVSDVLDLDHRTYAPNGGTALYDAVGHTLHATDEYVAKHHPDQVLFVIMTDGEENSSREFDRDRVFRLIEERQRDAGYEFIYLGANQDSYMVGQSMGIREGRMLDYAATPAGTSATMRRVSRNVTAHRRFAEQQAPVMFSPDFEAMADLEGPALDVHKERYVRETRKK